MAAKARDSRTMHAGNDAAAVEKEIARIEDASREEEREISDIKTLLLERKPEAKRKEPWLKDHIAIIIIVLLAAVVLFLMIRF